MKDYKTVFGSLVTGDWPSTVAKNASGPTATDGTPFTKDLIDDLWGWIKNIMSLAGLTPSGASDSHTSSQVVDALRRVIRGPGELVQSALNAATLATRRLLPLAGQVIAIASYPDLAAAVYCGDTDNPTAPAFYKTSDSGGLTRSTTGAYMVMPDARGLVIRGLGSNAKILKANGSAYSGGTAIAQLLTDMLQGHRHGLYGGNTAQAMTVSSSALGAVTATGTYDNQVRDAIADASGNGNPRTGDETRGASIAAQICITY